MYAEKLTEEQIREIMNLISDDGSVRIVQIRTYNSSFEDCVNWSKVPEVKAMFQETEETYRLHDYHIQGFHRAGAGSEYIYRKKCWNTLATNMPSIFCWNIEEMRKEESQCL